MKIEVDEDIKHEQLAYTLEEAEEICGRIDWNNPARLTEEERDAVVNVTSRYMLGEIERERCAKALHVRPEELPPRWPQSEPDPA